MAEQRSGIALNNLKAHERMLTRKPINHASYQTRGQWLRASDAYLAHSRVRQALYLFNALLQFIENCQASFEECPAIARRFHSSRGAIEEWNTKGVLHFRDCL